MKCKMCGKDLFFATEEEREMCYSCYDQTPEGRAAIGVSNNRSEEGSYLPRRWIPKLLNLCACMAAIMGALSAISTIARQPVFIIPLIYSIVISSVLFGLAEIVRMLQNISQNKSRDD